MNSPDNSRTGPRWYVIIVSGCVIIGLASILIWWITRSKLPRPGSIIYEQYVELFELGTAALDSGLVPMATEKLSEAVQLIPEEPAGWANRGLLFLRSNQLEKASIDLNRAYELAPTNPDIAELMGHLSEHEGKLDEATRHFEFALKAEPTNVQRLYRLADLAERHGDEAEESRKKILLKILELRPTSLPIIIELMKSGIRTEDRQTIDLCIARLEKLSSSWDQAARTMLTRVITEIRSDKPKDLVLLLGQLGNLLKAEIGYARSMEELNPQSSVVGSSLQQFLQLAPMQTAPSPPDTNLSLEQIIPKDNSAIQIRGSIFPAWINDKLGNVYFHVQGNSVRCLQIPELQLPFPADAFNSSPSPHSLLSVDLNNDQLSDLVLSGPGGIRIFLQTSNHRFDNITSKCKLPDNVVNRSYFGAWTCDLDLEGDLDLILAPVTGSPVILRNNGDGTFSQLSLFPDVKNLRGFCWVDLDNDGAPDAVMLDDAGQLHIYMNERAGNFRKREVPEFKDAICAITVADITQDSTFDIIVLEKSGHLHRLSDKDRGQNWTTSLLDRIDEKCVSGPGLVRLQAVDLDSNGSIDLLVRTSKASTALIQDRNSRFLTLATSIPPGLDPAVRHREDEPLTLFGVGSNGALERWLIKGSKGYQSDLIRLRANPKGSGDQRINSFAIGSEFEIRAKGLILKYPVDTPSVHVGLGSREKITVLRCVWTNGAAQYEFEKPIHTPITIEQRLKGSCPFLFTWDGDKMVFVSDFCWSTPLGLHINAQKHTGSFSTTTEWIKIRGDQLQPRNGYYDVRVNANLWETHYLDHLAMKVVDHPLGSELFCDERFFLTPTAPELHLTSTLLPIALARDHHGNDVTDLVKARDGKYLDRAARGFYQGVTNDHWVEIDLGPNAPANGEYYLIATGWTHPTDSSINAAISQGNHTSPKSLLLEIPDGKNGWKVAKSSLGFPAGKNKTILLRLDGIDGPGVCTRFRLRTNLEIYWDSIHYAKRLDPALVSIKSCPLLIADLRYRGIVQMIQQNSSSPELPNYGVLQWTHPIWRDLIGFHTKFGDVHELIEQVDDRYVILNAGDEIRLQFAPPGDPVPAGWKRDYVWISDGWTKDGDLNTLHGKTVLPLPYHAMKDYRSASRGLFTDPVYQRHAKDWENYHTRFITPSRFERGLRSTPNGR